MKLELTACLMSGDGGGSWLIVKTPEHLFQENDLLNAARWVSEITGMATVLLCWLADGRFTSGFYAPEGGTPGTQRLDDLPWQSLTVRWGPQMTWYDLETQK